MIAVLAALAAHAEVVAADHHGRAEGEGIGWTTTIRCTPGERVPLAVPVPRASVERVIGAAAEYDGDQLVAIEPSRALVILETRQPDREALRPPAPLDASALQQVSLEGLRYAPDEALGLSSRIGWRGPPGVTEADRRRALRELGEAWRHRHGATMLRVAGPLPSGLPGEVELGGKVPLAVVAGAVAAAIGLLLGLIGLHRGLEVLARRERIEAYFARGEQDRG